MTIATALITTMSLHSALALSGTRLWTGDVWVSADDNSGNERYPSIVTNGVGESRVVWVDGTYEGQVFAQSLQHDGSRSWSTDLAIHDWPNNGKTPGLAWTKPMAGT